MQLLLMYTEFGYLCNFCLLLISFHFPAVHCYM